MKTELQKPKAIIDDEVFLDITQIIVLFHVCKSTVKNWRKLDSFPDAIYLNHLPRWRKEDILNWANSNCSKKSRTVNNSSEGTR